MAKSTKSAKTKSKKKLSTKKRTATATPYRMRTRERELLSLLRDMKSDIDTGAAVASFSDRIDKTLSRYEK